jgi:hypothetical protein
VEPRHRPAWKSTTSVKNTNSSDEPDFELAIESPWQYDPPMTRTLDDTERRKPTASAQIKLAGDSSAALGTKTLTETRESLDQDPDSFYPSLRSLQLQQSGLEYSKNPKPACFVQLFQEPATKERSFAANPTKKYTNTRDTQNQAQSDSLELLTEAETRTHEWQDQECGLGSYHAIPRL